MRASVSTATMHALDEPLEAPLALVRRRDDSRERADVAAGHEVLAAPWTTRTRIRVRATSAAAGISVDHRLVEHVESVGTVERQRGDGPARASRTVSFMSVGDGHGGPCGSAETKAQSAFSV
jgi:hypothetical protein